MMREAQVKEICEKVSEEHFKALQDLRSEKEKLLVKNGKLA